MIEEILTDNLLQYGTMGLWLVTMLLERFSFQKKMTEVVQNNTKALIKVYEKLD